jgi:hypothetical protein
MGYAISWLAIKASASEALLENLGLSPSGEKAEYGESLFTGRTLPSGWFILVINECEHKFVKPKALAPLSLLGDVIGCSIEEHVMWSVAELWRNGAQLWRIEHDAQKSISHISSSGFLPDGYAAIERKFADEQKKSGGEQSDTDYFFEIPLQMAESIVGFKHDQPGPDSGTFMVFKGGTFSPTADRSSDQKTKPWWKLW